MSKAIDAASAEIALLQQQAARFHGLAAEFRSANHPAAAAKMTSVAEDLEARVAALEQLLRDSAGTTRDAG